MRLSIIWRYLSQDYGRFISLARAIREQQRYLELFLRNLLLNEKNELHNRYLHISGLWKMQKVDIGEGKVDIQSSKVDIESLIAVKATDFSEKTISHIYRMYDKFGFDMIFG